MYKYCTALYEVLFQKWARRSSELETHPFRTSCMTFRMESGSSGGLSLFYRIATLKQPIYLFKIKSLQVNEFLLGLTSTRLGLFLII